MTASEAWGFPDRSVRISWTRNCPSKEETGSLENVSPFRTPRLSCPSWEEEDQVYQGLVLSAGFAYAML